MKTLAAIGTALLAAVLLLTPMIAIASAASGTISVQTNATTYTTGQMITITGTLTPKPSGTPEIIVQVTGPAGVVFREPTTVTSGSFSVPAFKAAGSDWVTGSYTVLAGGLTGYLNGTTVFYLTTTSSLSSAVTLDVSATASTPLNAGQTAQVSAWVFWTNGTKVSDATFRGWVITPDGTPINASTIAMASPVAGDYWWNIPTSGFSQGLYAVILGARAGGQTAWTQTSFTIGDFATGAQMSVLSSDMMGNFTGLSSALSTLSTDMNGNFTAQSTSIAHLVAGLSTSVSGLSRDMNGNFTSISSKLGDLSTTVTNASNNVTSTQTYVLVVAVLAAIILVLALAILVRKLS